MDRLIAHFARLRKQLAEMVDDLALGGFSSDECDVVCAIIDLSTEETKPVSVNCIRDHMLCRNMTKPTFYRILHRLVDGCVLTKIGGDRSGLYQINAAWLARVSDANGPTGDPPKA